MGENITKRAKNKKSGSFRIIFGVITLNLWGLYLFLDVSFLLYFSLFATVILLFNLVIRLLGKNQETQGLVVYRKDLLILANKFIRINRTFLLATIVGIILSTMIISQTFILSSTYEQRIYQDYFGNSTPSVASFSEIDDSSLNISDMFPKMEAEIKQEFAEQQLIYAGGEVNKLTNIELISSEYYQYDISEYRIEGIGNRLGVMHESLYNVFRSFPSFDEEKIPYDPGKTYYFVDRSDSSYYKSDIASMVQRQEADILLDNGIFSGNIRDASFLNLTAHIDYFWEITAEDVQTFDDRIGWSDEYLANIFYGSILTNTSYHDELIEEIQQKQQRRNPYTPRNYFQFFTSIADLSTDGLEEILFKVDLMFRNLNNIARKYLGGVTVQSPLYIEINNFLEYSTLMRFSLLLASIPLLILSLFLVYFSITLVEQRKRRLLAVMKYRGTSEIQMRALLFSEVLSTGLISLVVGMILSIPYTIWNLTGEAILDTGSISISTDWYWKLPVLGIILALDINISSLLSLSKVSIDEMEVAEEKRKPLWQRMYLDLVIFILSIGMWVFLRTVPMQESIREALTFSAGPIALILLLVSAPLVIARYFSSFVEFFSAIMWRVTGGLIALATSNLRKNKYSASKLTALLSIGFMLSIMALTIPYTLEQNTYAEARYDHGADIFISGIDTSNSTQMSFLDAEGISSYSEIIHISLTNPSPSGSIGSNIYSYDFLGVNTSTIASTLFWEDRYSPYSLQEISKSLENNQSIGIQSQELIGLGLEVGENLTLQLTKNLQQDFLISSEYTYFPIIVDYLPWYDPYDDRYWIDSLSIVISLPMVQDLLSKTAATTRSEGVLVKVDEGYELDTVSKDLQEALGETIFVETYLDEFQSDFSIPEFVIILSLIEGMLFVTIVTGVVSVLYFAFITISDRKREIGIFRSFGMVRRQIFVLLLVEIISIVVTGLIFGGFVGYFLTSNFLHLFTVGNFNSAPGFSIYLPTKDMAVFSIYVLALTSISAAIPAFHTARKQTGSILRAE